MTTENEKKGSMCVPSVFTHKQQRCWYNQRIKIVLAKVNPFVCGVTGLLHKDSDAAVRVYINIIWPCFSTGYRNGRAAWKNLYHHYKWSIATPFLYVYTYNDWELSDVNPPLLETSGFFGFLVQWPESSIQYCFFTLFPPCSTLPSLPRC